MQFVTNIYICSELVLSFKSLTEQELHLCILHTANLH